MKQYQKKPHQRKQAYTLTKIWNSNKLVATTLKRLLPAMKLPSFLQRYK